MAWEHPFSLIFAFSIWGLPVPSARFSAISFSMDMLTFSHYHDFIIMSQLQCHDDHIVTGILKSFWMHFGSLVGGFLDHFGVMLSSEIVLVLSGSFVETGNRFSEFDFDHFGGFWRGFGKHFGDILLFLVDVNFIMHFDMIFK